VTGATTLTASTVMPFVPCEDFALSSRFYADLGFEKGFDDGRLAVFRCGTAAFYLQNYRWQSGLDNFMLLLDVADVGDWWRRVQAEDLAGKYGVRVIAPSEEPWGARVMRVIDPVGVLWHISQRIG
jgi:Glyoxalase/Bleomycin resistance protein/Dioxygenase superfamily